MVNEQATPLSSNAFIFINITIIIDRSFAFDKALPSLRLASVENLIDLEQEGPVVTANDFECIVLYDFVTHEEDRLDVKRGTVLRISQDENYIDRDWWFATTTDDHRSGWVPINYCKRI